METPAHGNVSANDFQSLKSATVNSYAEEAA
jgi:hypothetical protein